MCKLNYTTSEADAFNCTVLHDGAIVSRLFSDFERSRVVAGKEKKAAEKSRVPLPAAAFPCNNPACHYPRRRSRAAIPRATTRCGVPVQQSRVPLPVAAFPCSKCDKMCISRSGLSLKSRMRTETLVRRNATGDTNII